MRKRVWSLPLIFLVSFGGALSAKTDSAPAVQEIHVERATEAETRHVQELSDAFERRMRETRDIGSLKDLFISDFMRLHFEEERASGPPLMTALPVSIESQLIPQVTQQEWERFYAAELNLRYYFVLLIASRTKPGEIEHSNQDFSRKLFRPEVLTVLRSDPFLRQQYGGDSNQTNTTIKSIAELRSLISTFEQATLMLREDFLKHPPERTPTYQENAPPASNKARTSGQLVMPDIWASRENHLGFPAGTRFYHRLTSDSMFELWMVRTDAGMKICWARVYPFN